MSAAGKPGRRPRAQQAHAGQRSRLGGEIVAVLQRRGRFVSAEPFFTRAGPGGSSRSAPPVLSLGSPRSQALDGVRDGDLVLLNVGARGRARLVRRIGRPQVAADVIEAVLYDRGLRRGFGQKAQREADELAAEPVDFETLRNLDDELQSAEQAPRVDLRELATFTVDPVEARDFDDAISAEDQGYGRTRVWVHIADVSAYVREGTALDREAHRRGNSIYAPGTVEPMLPEALSGNLCSLRQGLERLTVSVELQIAAGSIERVAFHRSMIRSDTRLDYGQVDEIFAGRGSADGHWGPGLAAARSAAEALAERRRRRGALQLESFEPEIAFDREGHAAVTMRGGNIVSGPASAQDRPGGPSPARAMIEELMIAANEAVAGHLQQARIPCLYRVHDRPKPERVELLLEQLASLEVPTPPLPENLSASQAAELMAQISAAVQAELSSRESGRIALSSLLLRALQQAVYSPRNIGHAGLASSAYCHFTSPIRRYPDIICHRALLASIGGGSPARSSELQELGEWCSQREREAMVIERDCDDVARCFALEQLLGREGPDRIFSGEVVGLIGAGAFVAFGPAPAQSGELPAYEGMLASRTLKDAYRSAASSASEASDGGAGPQRARAGTRGRSDVRSGRDDWWELNEPGTVLSSPAGGSLRLGQAVQVQVQRIDKAAGKVDLLPVAPAEAKRPARMDSPRSRRAGLRR